MKKLIAYFSRSGNNYVNGSIKNLEVGNTEIAAKMIKEITGSDIFKIEPIRVYSIDYSRCIEEAKDDLNRDARPELKDYLDSIEEYDVIYLGYPNYWGTMPMAVFTFLEKYDFSNKIIKPFCTHEGSGTGRSINDIKKICPQAKIKSALSIHGADVKQAGESIKKWI